jgi:hypothetical protein
MQPLIVSFKGSYIYIKGFLIVEVPATSFLLPDFINQKVVERFHRTSYIGLQAKHRESNDDVTPLYIAHCTAVGYFFSPLFDDKTLMNSIAYESICTADSPTCIERG